MFFFLHKPYFDDEVDGKMVAKWERALGRSHVIHIGAAKALVDIILGVIAVYSGARTLEGYCEDLENRGQTRERLTMVKASIGHLKKEGEEEEEEKEEEEKEKEEKKIVTKVTTKKITTKMEPQEIKRIKDTIERIRGFGIAIPPTFICPITQEVMIDPVFTEDGNTYEREAIREWLEAADTSPLTNEKLDSKSLTPNLAIRKNCGLCFQ